MTERTTVYDGLSNEQAFAKLEENILISAGVEPEAQLTAHRTLGDVAKEFKKHANQGLEWQAPADVWSVADDELRTVLIGGTVARSGWDDSRRKRTARDTVYARPGSYGYTGETSRLFDLSTPELIQRTVGMTATAAYEHVWIAYIPPSMLPALSEAYHAGNTGQRMRILGSMTAMLWGRSQILDSDDPHPITQWLKKPDIHGPFASHLIDLAINEIDVPDSRPKLLTMLWNTHKAHPEKFDDFQTRALRRLSRLPQDDDEYEAYVSQQAAKVAAQQQRVQDGVRESELKRQELRATATEKAKRIIDNR